MEDKEKQTKKPKRVEKPQIDKFKNMVGLYLQSYDLLEAMEEAGYSFYDRREQRIRLQEMRESFRFRLECHTQAERLYRQTLYKAAKGDVPNAAVSAAYKLLEMHKKPDPDDAPRRGKSKSSTKPAEWQVNVR